MSSRYQSSSARSPVSCPKIFNFSYLPNQFGYSWHSFLSSSSVRPSGNMFKIKTMFFSAIVGILAIRCSQNFRICLFFFYLSSYSLIKAWTCKYGFSCLCFFLLIFLICSSISFSESNFSCVSFNFFNVSFASFISFGIFSMPLWSKRYRKNW